MAEPPSAITSTRSRIEVGMAPASGAVWLMPAPGRRWPSSSTSVRPAPPLPTPMPWIAGWSTKLAWFWPLLMPEALKLFISGTARSSSVEVVAPVAAMSSRRIVVTPDPTAATPRMLVPVTVTTFSACTGCWACWICWAEAPWQRPARAQTASAIRVLRAPGRVVDDVWVHLPVSCHWSGNA
jgi:hypothetical protein